MLVVAPLDVPLDEDLPKQPFRREREWLYGEGIATSRSSLVILEFALHSLRAGGVLKAIPLGVLLYSDEGRDARYSGSFIRKAAGKVRKVLVLDPVPRDDMIVVRRGGENKYGFRRETPPRWLGEANEELDVVGASIDEIQRLKQGVSRRRYMSFAVIDFETERLPALYPHKVTATLLLRYRGRNRVHSTEEKIRSLLEKAPNPAEIRLISERPPLPSRMGNDRLARTIVRLAEQLDLELAAAELPSPSVAGLIPAKAACVSGLGAYGRDFGNANESVNRLSLTQRALLLVRVLSQGRATRLSRSEAG